MLPMMEQKLRQRVLLYMYIYILKFSTFPLEEQLLGKYQANTNVQPSLSIDSELATHFSYSNQSLKLCLVSLNGTHSISIVKYLSF